MGALGVSWEALGGSLGVHEGSQELLGAFRRAFYGGSYGGAEGLKGSMAHRGGLLGGILGGGGGGGDLGPASTQWGASLGGVGRGWVGGSCGHL